MGILHESFEELILTVQDPRESDRAELTSPDVEASLGVFSPWRVYTLS